MASGLKVRVGRVMSTTTRRFARDVAASAIATGVATLAFSHLAHEPAPDPAARPPGKLEERLSWKTEDVPTRLTTTYDTISMFSLPVAAASAWSDTHVPAAAEPVAETRIDLAKADPVRPARLRNATARPGEPRPSRVAAASPPSRPVALAWVEAPLDAVVASEPEARAIRVLGWAVPGTDLIPSPPDAYRSVAAFGGKVASLGGSLAETIGLR